MKTKKMMRPIAMAACMLALVEVHAQTSVLGNTPTSPGTDYVGWDNSTTVPLEVRHNGNQPIWLFTDAIWRATMNETVTYGLLGAYSSIPANGFTLLGEDAAEFKNGGAPGPYTMLHLAAATDNAQQLSYRPWMRTGVTFTGNADHGYVGQKGKELDYTDMIIHWSDNPGEVMKDRLRFLFTSGYNSSAASGAESEEGLEFMRMWPNRYEDPHIGVGDFYAANLADPSITEPTERLDMVNGRLRIRELPETTGEATGSYKVMVVDDAAYPSDERGVVKWVDPAVLTGSPDCDWTIQNEGISGSAVPHNVYTAVGSSDVCPDFTDKVGIGTASPLYKLDVAINESDASMHGGLRVAVDADNNGAAQGIVATVVPVSGLVDYMYGVRSILYYPGIDGYGISSELYVNDADADGGHAYGMHSNATISAGDFNGVYGLRSWATITTTGLVNASAGVEARSTGNGSNLTNSFGINSKATGGQVNYGLHVEAFGSGVTNYAVMALAPSTGANFNYAVRAYAPDQTDSWAVWSEGRQFSTTSSTWTTSDAALKQNIEAYQGGLEKVLLLEPKSYQYQTSTYDYMNLPEGNQVGLIAQEVEAVLPDLVMEATRPADLDSLGNEVAPETSFKVMQYGGLIPILVSAVKEMNAGMAQMQGRIDQLEQQLAACCAASPTDSDQRSGSVPAEEQLTPAQERLLRIAPNPFTDRTTLYCTLERAGRMQLMANSSDGRDLRMLSEGQREAGEFQYEWSTEHLAPGVYYVTLLLDGEPVVKTTYPVVKRAVKLGR